MFIGSTSTTPSSLKPAIGDAGSILEWTRAGEASLQSDRYAWTRRSVRWDEIDELGEAGNAFTRGLHAFTLRRAADGLIEMS